MSKFLPPRNVELPGIYGTKSACAFLKCKIPRFKYHLYQGHIQADAKYGHALVFVLRTLLDFMARYPSPGAVPTVPTPPMITDFMGEEESQAAAELQP